MTFLRSINNSNSLMGRATVTTFSWAAMQKKYQAVFCGDDWTLIVITLRL